MITLEKAKQALVAAEKKATELGTAITTVIVDDHGSIIAVSRMDGAIHISPKFAYAKAFSSANLGVPSEVLGQYSGEGKPFIGINTLFGGELTGIAGGLPVKMQGKVVGAVGVGGSMDVSQDATCAQEAVKTLAE
jgi:uncharacterized protein GlcG (DUF336 family)